VSFAGQAWLVTGASSGIGLAIARQLVAAGAKVALMARRAEVLEGLRTAWGKPDQVLVVAGDVTSRDALAAAVSATVQAFGKLDGVVHSAGASMRAKIAEAKPEVYRQLMDLNYFSTVDLAQLALAPLTATKGSFVVISSTVGKITPPWRSGYVASKHAVAGFCGSLRIEVADQGVHVLVVSPGFVRTEISRNALTADGSAHAQLDADTAQGLEPEEVARQVLVGIRDRVREVAPAGFRESAAMVLARVAPGLLDRLLLRRLRSGRDTLKAPED
jgi:NADP-dependent 3-hydroxy acid dehydrogenase YdfG